MPARSLLPAAARAALLGATVLLAACGDTQASADAVSLEVARAELESGRAVLIDIREPEEHATGVAPGAQLLPMRQLSRRLAEVPVDPAQPVLLICNTQNRSSATLRALRERGYGHVRYVDGGMREWARRGWPMVPPGQPARKPGT
ncbi:rhodanese-like domain-containing protein [Rubrivivax sp. RP6-9]|uniref:rhodanese-like domain-containing protein n=1 Tax=Rubrivivax sp. RP6-9 TaxID=3415750 RepID=UPI003CC562CC